MISHGCWHIGHVPESITSKRRLTWPRKQSRRLQQRGRYWGTLGIAHYRAGQWGDALTAFQEATKLRNGDDSLEWFYLAMIHWRLGEEEQARKWYDQALQRVEENDPDSNELKHIRNELKNIRAEAAELLNIKESAPVENWLKQLIKRGLAQ